jgi:hypothetical protein
MHTLQHEVLVNWHTNHPLLRRRAPSQDNYAVCPNLRHSVNHFLRKKLPPLALMRVGFALSHRQARVQQQNATISPGRQQAALVRRSLVIRVLFLEGFVDVLEGRRSGVRWTDGEAEAVGLVGAVVGILACDDNFDGVEGCVS